MESINKITCPKCGHGFNAEQALAHDIEQKLKATMNQKYKELQAKMMKEAEEKEDLLKKQMLADKAKLEEQLKVKVKEDYELQMKAFEAELENKKKENLELKKKELDLLTKQKALKEREEEMEMNFQKKMLERSNEIEAAARKKAEEENQMKMREKDMQMQAMKDQIEIMKKKAEQGSMQLQGEVQELILEELLRATFTFDLIEEVGKGVRGADVIHTVRNTMGRDCGKIIYESKRTKAFSEGWIDKLKEDMRGQSADIGLLVTETMPKEMPTFGLKDGIWICTFSEAKGVAMILRDSLIKISDIRSSQENKGDKMQMLYDYLTANEFKNQIEAIVEGFTSMQAALTKEKMQMHKIWKEREKQLEKICLNTVDIYGAVRGIAGKAVAEIKQLESPEMFLEGETEE